MTPVIALVGRPNVGKSTFFNRLTQTQDALVADFPGLTRDRQYGEATFENKSFIVVDTGGVGVEDAAVDALMLKQSEIALLEASQIFFLVDGRHGRTALDDSIANRLRKLGKPVHLIVNKIDGVDEYVACSEFQALGFPSVFPISASHGIGVQRLLKSVTQAFPSTEMAEPSQDNLIKIAFVGRPNVGKSTLINRLLGEERVVVYDLPGTTRDSIQIPFERDGQKYALIDTAGIRRRARVEEKVEKFSIIKTLQSIHEAHVCLVLLDAAVGVTEQDLHLLGFVLQAGKALVIAINKWDGLEEDHKKQVRNELDRRLGFIQFAKFRFISALHGSGVGLLFKDVLQAYASAMQSLSTSKLTRVLQALVTEHPPPLVKGRRIKLRYAHPGGHNPPLVVVHGNQVEAIPESYKRYLMNGFTQKLHLVGTPLKLEFKTGENPYQGKRNPLTPRQRYRRKRLMKHVK